MPLAAKRLGGSSRSMITMAVVSLPLQWPLTPHLRRRQVQHPLLPPPLPFTTLALSIKLAHAPHFICNPNKYGSENLQFNAGVLSCRPARKPNETARRLLICAAIPPPAAVAVSGAVSAAIWSAVLALAQNFSLTHVTSPLIPGTLLCSPGPLFFAAMGGSRRAAVVNTPLTVVASGMAKWLELYSGVLMVRVLLSWFPNIPWDRQPLSAIRDMCDPYLNLFRNIIPPVFNALDLSPLLAFLVLGFLTSVLNNSMGSV